MSGDPYSAKVRELFAAPAHAGDIAGGVAVQVADQDIRLRLSASVAGGQIEALRFRVWGCPHVIAAAEAVCSALEGRPAADLENYVAADVMQNLPVPVEKTGRILVIEDAVRSLGQQLRDRT
ncbi:MAG: iron-sulfur cluster assembly scaffold protein [Woeseiaceae bacterium]